MSKQTFIYIAQILSNFRDMGATDAELEAEKKVMMEDPEHLSHNLYLLENDTSLEENLHESGII